MEADIELLSERHGGYWGEHPNYPTSDWALAVVDNDTRRGYWEWVESRVRDAADSGDADAQAELRWLATELAKL